MFWKLIQINAINKTTNKTWCDSNIIYRHFYHVTMASLWRHLDSMMTLW